MSTKTRASDEMNAIAEQVNRVMSDPARPRHRPMPAPSQMMQTVAGMQDLRNEVTQLKADAGKSLTVPLASCEDGPHHTAPLDLQRVANLKANLAMNAQSTPAQVRPIGEGRYQIISGRHRKAALLELGRENWDVTIRDVDDDTAERLTFYDNLFAPSLSDYERYLGFARRKDTKRLTNDQMSQESGVSRSTVTRLMAFSNLPPEAIEHVKRNTQQVGGRLAEELSPLVAKHRERVVEAVGLVVDGRLAATKAAAWVLDAKKPAAQKPNELVIRRGKKTYAKVQRNGARVVVSFTDPKDAGAVEKELSELLERHAAAPA